MNTDAEKTAIQAVLNAVRQGLHEKDAAAIGAQFASNAVIFDLAPPLAHGLDVPGLSAWLDGWDGPVDQEWRDMTIDVGGDVAFCRGLCKMTATTKADSTRRIGSCDIYGGGHGAGRLQALGPFQTRHHRPRSHAAAAPLGC